MTWAPQPAPVRSRPEAAALTQRADATAISGALLLDEPDLDERPRLYRTIAWNTNAQDLRPVLIAPDLEEHDIEEREECCRLGTTTLDYLMFAPPEMYNAALPTSPTGLAEELMTAFTTMLLDEHTLINIISHTAEHLPQHTESLEGYDRLLQSAPWATTLTCPTDFGSLGSDIHSKILAISHDPTPKPTQNCIHNLWLVFR